MITIQKINSLESGDTGLGQYHISEAGAALAHIPEFKAFYDAEVYSNLARRIMNRVTGQYAELNGNFTLINDPLPLLRKTIVANNTVSHVGDYDINPNEWTFFMVVHPNYNSNTVQSFRLVRAIDINTVDTIYLFMSSSRRTLSWYGDANGGVPRTTYAFPEGQGLADLPHPSLVMFTFSTQEGCKIRVNGKTVATTLTEAGKVPKTNALKAGEWDMMRNADGDFYAWGGLNIDLTRDANVDYLTALELYFMNKYQIPVLA